MQTDARAPRAKKCAAISLENSDKLVGMSQKVVFTSMKNTNQCCQLKNLMHLFMTLFLMAKFPTESFSEFCPQILMNWEDSHTIIAKCRN